jgi:hypothetical protein
MIKKRRAPTLAMESRGAGKCKIILLGLARSPASSYLSIIILRTVVNWPSAWVFGVMRMRA